MNVIDQEVRERYAIYNGDAMDVMRALPDSCIGLSVFSPPFGTEGGGALYTYTSDERDLSNAPTYASFLEHYGFIARELARVTMPGRMACVHCMDVPTGNSGGDALADFPGDLIRVHRAAGWSYAARYHVWKEPLAVRNRTLRKDLAHKTIVEDSSRCTVAGADYLLVFRNRGENPEPIVHPNGLTDYAGAREVPHELLRYRGWAGKQTENRYSHWIWRQYASAFWDDVRMDRVLPFRESRDEEDERHVHPFALDVVDRALVLWSNPGEAVFDPFMGVGSVPYVAVRAGRFGLGAEIKPSYFRQATKNLRAAEEESAEQADLFSSSGIAV